MTAAVAVKPSGHSPIGASVAHRYLACPASVPRSEGIEDAQSSEAAEGTLLHEVAAFHLTGGVAVHGTDATVWGQTLHLEDEQRDVIAAYTNEVRSEAAMMEHPIVKVETGFHLPLIDPLLWGTADAVVYENGGGALTVLDLKCGRGVEVKADYDGKLNPQLGVYMLGALHSLGWVVKPGEVRPKEGMLWFTDLTVVIVQPRLGGVKRRRVALVELEDLTLELAEAIALTRADDPPARAGDHCRFCRARGTCPTLREHAVMQAYDEFGELLDAQEMDHAALAEALDEADVLENWIRSVRERAHALMERGHAIPGWKLVQKRATRKWRDADATLLDLIDVLGLPADEVTKQELLSPAKLEPVLKRHGVDKDFVAERVTKESTGTTMARASDSRPAVSAGAAHDFDD